MSADPRAALNQLVAAFERHLEASSTRHGDDDPSVVAAYEDLADAFEAYDGALYDAYGEMTPLDIYTGDDGPDEDDDDTDSLDDHDDEDGDGTRLYAGLDEDLDFDDDEDTDGDESDEAGESDDSAGVAGGTDDAGGRGSRG